LKYLNSFIKIISLNSFLTIVMYKIPARKKLGGKVTNKKKVIKIQCPFERIKKYNANPEAGLYKAVIMQMIIDASNSSNDPKACRNEKRAKAWLFAGGDDFDSICVMAGIKPNIVQIFAKTLIAMHHDKARNVTKLASKRNSKSHLTIVRDENGVKSLLSSIN
jgi:hypothetical protein